MDMNMANRQCCDLDIRDYKTKAPWMFADFCNTTTAGFTAEAVYAMKKGAKGIKFDNPLEATISMSFQVHPFRLYAMLSDGEIETSAMITRKETITCSTAGKLDLTNTPVMGTVFAYEKDNYGVTPISGTVSGKAFTATTAADIAVDQEYIVAYIENKASGVKRVSFNNKKVPKYFHVQMDTLDKNEDGKLIPVRLTAYKVSPQRNLELSFSSTGDPAEVTITFDCMEDDKGNVLDMIELTDESV